MNSDDEIKAFLNSIAERFPDVAEKMQKHDEYMLTSKMEEFSRATTIAMGREEKSTVIEHLSYISEKLKVASEKEREYIDVSYVEPLMSGLSHEQKKWAWALIPGNLQDLYIGFWGKSDFMN